MEDELNDSSGIYWIDLEELDIKNSSPLILKLKQELSNDKNTLEKVIYKNWEILIKELIHGKIWISSFIIC